MCFSFGVLTSKYSGSVAGRNAIRTRQSKTIFAGENGFTLPQLFFKNGGDFTSAAQEGARGMHGVIL